jgi:hypothetical protein
MFSSDGTGRIRYILLQSHPACDQTNRTHPRLNNPSILITKSKPLWNRPIVTPIVTSIHSHVHLALVSTPAGGPRSEPMSARRTPWTAPPAGRTQSSRFAGASQLHVGQVHPSHRIASASVNVLRVQRTTSFVLLRLGCARSLGDGRLEGILGLTGTIAVCGWMGVCTYIGICETSCLSADTYRSVRG